MSETRVIHCLQHNILLLVSTMLCNLFIKQIYFSLLNTLLYVKSQKSYFVKVNITYWHAMASKEAFLAPPPSRFLHT